MKYWAVMEFLTPETTDRIGVASFVESREEVIDVVRVRLSVVGSPTRPTLQPERSARCLGRLRCSRRADKRGHQFLQLALSWFQINCEKWARQGSRGSVGCNRRFGKWADIVAVSGDPLK